MADFTPSVIFLSTQPLISQLDIAQNKSQKFPLAKSPPAPLPNVVTLQKISVNSQQSTLFASLMIFCSARHSSSKLDSALAYRKNSTVAMRR